MPNPIEILQNLLQLEQIAPNEYRGQSHNPGWHRVYGGQVIAQAILSASKSAPDMQCHSIHGYFMRPGDPEKPITYKIDPVRDGRSFQTRMLYAAQGNQKIFAMGASFHKQEDGPDHQDEMGDIPHPDDLTPIKQLMEENRDKLPPEVVAYFEKDRPFEMRPLDISRYIDPKPAPAVHSFWIRAISPLAGDTAYHQAALGYASDFTLLDTALIPHGKLLFDPSLMVASLDHSMWFHRPFKADEWLLYRQTSSNAFGARALCHGQFFNLKGQLIASTAQEGLTRPKTT